MAYRIRCKEANGKVNDILVYNSARTPDYEIDPSDNLVYSVLVTSKNKCKRGDSIGSLDYNQKNGTLLFKNIFDVTFATMTAPKDRINPPKGTRNLGLDNFFNREFPLMAPDGKTELNGDPLELMVEASKLDER